MPRCRVHREWLLIELRSDWHGRHRQLPGGHAAGRRLRRVPGRHSVDLAVVFEPDAHTALHQYTWTRDNLILVTLADVASRVQVVTPGILDARPMFGEYPPTPTPSSSTADDTGDEIFVDSSGFTTPSRLLCGTGRRVRSNSLKSRSGVLRRRRHRRHPALRHLGGRHGDPVLRCRAPRLERPRARPCSAGYGGFEISRTPGYDGVLGRLWLARGGTYVVANIRGGGEYGPGWHTQAMRENRHQVYEDFAAVAADLVARGITTVDQLGAQGGSNGGLLMGVMLTQLPGAVRRGGVPGAAARHEALPPAAGRRVLDGRVRRPRRPGRLGVHLANTRRTRTSRPTRAYPALLMTTSTRDDRVHPGHARKMTAALEAAGHPVLLLREHRGRPRRRGRQRADRVQVGAELRVPVAGPGRQRLNCPGSSKYSYWRNARQHRGAALGSR